MRCAHTRHTRIISERIVGEDPIQGKSVAPVLDPFGRGGALNSTTFTGLSFSQITRCLSGAYTAYAEAKYTPCTSAAKPLPDLKRAYNYMGYSVRSLQWRLTEWLPWNKTNDCPEWDNEAVGMRELYVIVAC